jgi:hydroxymethylglutaryl-CoA reductase
MPRRRKRDYIIKGFSKLLKEDKLKIVAELMDNQVETIELLKSFWHPDRRKQKIFDEFSENTISNFYIPYGVAPNVKINDVTYLVPMVIEESSVVAAASSSAKWWLEHGGFHADVINVEKIGQVHFSWSGDINKLRKVWRDLVSEMRSATTHITSNMEKRGGGIIDFELIDKTDKIKDYYQIKVSFNTMDSMGANFINSCLEEFGQVLKNFVKENPVFDDDEKELTIIMAILSNYTPNCIVRSWVECNVDELNSLDDKLTGEQFAKKFETAVKIAEVDVYRATTHNKGIFNGIDAVAIATGNDFRAIEAAGHTYASQDGKYKSLSHVELKDGKFKFYLELPLAVGTVGGLTSLHPLAKHSLEMLGNPSAKELMMISATMGLANNFAAVRSLVTKGIQKGHMKMHLMNILNHFNANEQEKQKAIEYFKDKKVSFAHVSTFINDLRSH